MSANGSAGGEAALKNVMGDFVSAYAGRDNSVAFSDWLGNKLQEELPSMSSDSCQKLSDEIIETISRYDSTLAELNNAVEAGQSKEEWLADRMADAYVDMPMVDAGAKLHQIENSFNVSNEWLMGETDEIPEGEAVVVDAVPVEWNEYSVKNKVYEIGKQAALSGLAAAAGTIKENIENGGTAGIGDVIGEALQNGMETASGEIKAAVAGAVKVAAEKKLTKLLPENTPTETICDMAGVAVESAGALYDVACGKSTLTEAAEKTGRASIAMACRFGADVLKGKLASIPVVGPIIVDLAGGLLDHLKGPKFADGVYTVLRDTAVATWEGIKESGRRFMNKFKNFITNMQFN